MLDKLRPQKLRNQLPAAHQAPLGKRRCFQPHKTCKKNFLHVSNMTKNQLPYLERCAVRLPGVIVLEHVAFIVLEPLPINPTFTAPLHCCHIDCKKNSKSRPRSAFRALLLALNWGPHCGPKKGTSAACVNMAGPKNGDEICTQKRNPESPQLLAPCWTNCGHKNCETSSQRRIKPHLEKDAAFSLTRLAKRFFCMSPT